MGSLLGHVAPGLGFLLIGIWHLFNHIKLHLLNPNSYTSPLWFPTSIHKYLELLYIMAATTAFNFAELIIAYLDHLFDPDGTISFAHFHNFEHVSISLTFFTYATFSIILDQIKNKTRFALPQLLAAVAFAQEFIVFHFHSSDHMGPEGQYHLLLQLVIFICMVTTLLGISMHESFLISFMRSLSILFQGVWFIVMGYMLWTPRFIAKGCFIIDEEGNQVVRCEDNESLHRAIALVNIMFSCFVIGLTVFGVSFYLVLNGLYGENVNDVHVGYFPLENVDERKDDNDVESQKGNMLHGNITHVGSGKTFSPLDMGR